MSHSLQQEILSIIGKTKEIHMNQLDMFEALSNYGIDSLDMINILFDIQDRYDIEISEASIDNKEWSTVDKILYQLKLRGVCNELTEKELIRE
ncbi:MAG: acyl carrier protein [Pseudomonadota bacterium]